MNDIKFETINGTLCRMVEPTPLTPEATFPCVVRLIQDDSPMGLCNRWKYSEKKDFLRKYWTISSLENNLNKVKDIHYSQFEIIGYPVVEGSKEWALHQMMQGKKFVSSNGTVYWQDKDDNDLIKYTDGYGQIWVQTPYMFLKCVGASGWQLYKEQRYSCLFYEEGAPVSTVKSLSGSQIKRIMAIMKEGENA